MCAYAVLALAGMALPVKVCYVCYPVLHVRILKFYEQLCVLDH